jgi:transcriptional regulator with XRE-family HTH domain
MDILFNVETEKASNARAIGPMSKAVSAELRAALARAKMSVSRLATESGMAKSTLHKTLNAQRAVDVEDLYFICDYLGVQPETVIAAATVVANKEIIDVLTAQDDEMGRNVGGSGEPVDLHTVRLDRPKLAASPKREPVSPDRSES